MATETVDVSLKSPMDESRWVRRREYISITGFEATSDEASKLKSFDAATL
jgi:hypothetical protein